MLVLTISLGAVYVPITAEADYAWEQSTRVSGQYTDTGHVEVAQNGAGMAVAAYIAKVGSAYVVYANVYHPDRGWSSPVRLDPAASSGSSEPMVVLSEGGNATVVWKEWSSPSKLCSSHYNRSTGWSQREVVAVGGSFSSGSSALAMTSDGEVFCAWMQQNPTYSNWQISIYRHSGSGWSKQAEAVSGVGHGVINPQMAADGSGNLLLAWTNNTDGANLYVQRYSKDAGWQAPDRVAQGVKWSLETTDPSFWLSVSDNGKALVSYVTGLSGSRVLACRSYGAGAWGAEQTVTASAADAAYVRSTIDDKGDVFVCWVNGMRPDCALSYRAYTPGGGWSPVLGATDLGDGVCYPTLCTSGTEVQALVYRFGSPSQAYLAPYNFTTGWGAAEALGPAVCYGWLDLDVGHDAYNGIYAWNVNGVQVKIKACSPAAPTLTQVAAGSDQLTLSWQVPAGSGGSTVTAYRVYRSAGGQPTALVATVPGGQLSFADCSVARGATYTYYVTAVNAAGEGARSNGVQATACAPPSAPVSLVAQGGWGHVNLTWQAPLDNGGAPVSGYKVYAGEAGQGLALVANVTTCSYLDPYVEFGKTYRYQVRAVNAAGDGALSAPAEGTPYLEPGEVSALHVVAGNGYVVLDWQAPLFDGGTPVLDYKIYRAVQGGYMEAVGHTGSASVLSYNDTAVTKGTTYVYEVRARNEVAENYLSTSRTVRVPDPKIALISPVVGGELERGASYWINWTAQDCAGGVDISLMGPGGNWSIVRGCQNNGSYLWTVPGDIPLGTRYTLVLTLSGQATPNSTATNLAVLDKTPPAAPPESDATGNVLILGGVGLAAVVVGALLWARRKA